LTSTPFSLPWGSSIFAKIQANNTYGLSGISPGGNGAIILTNPDAPLNLVEVMAAKTSKSIGLSWTQGVQNGGAPVTNYTISYN
jgi:hypothetical protein